MTCKPQAISITVGDMSVLLTQATSFRYESVDLLWIQFIEPDDDRIFFTITERWQKVDKNNWKRLSVQKVVVDETTKN
jgi:hypothetical protein